jgi:branched-chain amino acid transport system ATP-binding protein
MTLAVESLSISRSGRRVVHGMSLHVACGEIVALLGANGAGKSTLVMTCVGVHRPDAGTVMLEGRRIDTLSPDRIRASGVALVPEGHRVIAKLTVGENLRVATLHLSPAQSGDAIDHALTLFPELKALLGQSAGVLSGGQKQMVSISQGLLAQPKILIVDELSLGLAPIIVKRLMVALKSIAAQGVGILLVEQFTALALSVANRAYLMDLGRLEFSGAAQQLVDHPEILHRTYLAKVQDQ